MLCLLLSGSQVLGQAKVRVSGRVFDMSKVTPLGYVSILSNSGAGTLTDTLGRYAILLAETDSLWFSYLGKPTPKYAVKNIPNVFAFEIALHVNVTELKQVMVKPRDYIQDSIQNRLDYAKVFNWNKPGIGISTSPGGGVGLDIGQLVDMFKFRRNKRMQGFQDRLLREEEEKYIDHRFSRPLVVRLTGLRGVELDSFIVRYRPNVYFVQFTTDYELQAYIKDCYREYKQGLPPNPARRPEDPIYP